MLAIVGMEAGLGAEAGVGMEAGLGAEANVKRWCCQSNSNKGQRAVPGLEIRVFDSAIVYFVDIG